MAEHSETRVEASGTAEWLVSVRDEQEFVEAASFGVDIIDLKEPGRGALAPVDRRFWDYAARSFASFDWVPKPRLSAALGEQNDAIEIAGELPREFAFAKAGPSGCSDAQAIQHLWSDVRSKLAPQIELVAVAYADAGEADCIEPETVLEESQRAGLQRCLIDTFSKNGQSSIERMGIERMMAFDQLAKRLGIWWALAGSIVLTDIATLATRSIQADCIAVRGDVCDGDRAGKLCLRRMRAWSQSLGRGIIGQDRPSVA